LERFAISSQGLELESTLNFRG